MSTRNLNRLFEPRSVAVIGASNRKPSVGESVMRNLLRGGYSGPIMPVNPKYEAVAGVLAYPDVDSLPITPDLAVLCTPPATVPDLIRRIGSRGTKAAIVLSAGLDLVPSSPGLTLEDEMLQAAGASGLRVVGPNCVGLLVPGIGLNASFAHTDAIPGQIGFISQSGALCTAVLDWAKSNRIGFSHFISLGNGADVDFGDALDYLASEPTTRAILLYIESIRQARKFLSAARAAARNKPVLVVKSGRVPEGSRAASSHTGALAGNDAVYDAAIRRAGMLRVDSIDDLFGAVEMLGRAHPLSGDRLTILTNGGGPGVMATDAHVLGGGMLASLSPSTLEKLDAVLPRNWSRSNPVDIIGDATAERYTQALKLLIDAEETDAILFIHSPTAIVPGESIATAIASIARQATKNIIGCWIGGDSTTKARETSIDAGIPTYDTPHAAVEAFRQMVDYRRNQALLMEIPPRVSVGPSPDTDRARNVIDKALTEGRELLTEPEAKRVLSAYGIPVVETQIATTASDAARVASKIGFPVALKVLSRQLSHKSDIGGVVLDLESEAEVAAEAAAMNERLEELRPDVALEGFTVQMMARRPRAHELIVGAATDPVFGPVILFGRGGTAVEVIADRAVSLPPLNSKLARELVEDTQVSRLLCGYRDRPAADQEAIYRTLVQVSQLLVEIPEIVEFDINPLLADETGVLALDARMSIFPYTGSPTNRLSILPYPKELEEWTTVDGHRVLVRPIRPEDEPEHHALLESLDPQDIRFRFFGSVRRFAHTEMARFTQIDYDREMAFIATGEHGDGQPETLAVVRAMSDPDNVRAEFAILVHSRLKGKGLGRFLIEKLIRYCRAKGTKEIVGQILSDNTAMLRLAKNLGFERRGTSDDGMVEVRLEL